MKILLNYIQGAFANLLQNRVYAVFYILVTAFTFLFISVLLHLAILIAGNKEPYNYAKRIVTVPRFFFQ